MISISKKGIEKGKEKVIKEYKTKISNNKLNNVNDVNNDIFIFDKKYNNESSNKYVNTKRQNINKILR